MLGEVGEVVPGYLTEKEQAVVTELQCWQQYMIDEAMKGMPPQWHPLYEREWRTRMQRVLEDPYYKALSSLMCDVYWRSAQPLIIVKLENQDGSKNDAPRDRREDARIGAGEP